MQAAASSEYGQFIQILATFLNIQLVCYKPQQMERRIRDLARKHQAASLPAFAEMLRTNRDLLREFEQHITINVSEFYRNPEAFDYLRTAILPQILANRRSIRVWSAGCSNGAEPFTLAMLLQEIAGSGRHTVLATDIDRAMLAKAKQGGSYLPDELRALPRPLRDRYIVAEQGAYRVAASLLQLVRFGHHDLLRETMTQSFDLIVCRNVVIYFTDEAKTFLYKKFADALAPGGYLFIGATETIGRPRDFGLTYVAPCFYAKQSDDQPVRGMASLRARG